MTQLILKKTEPEIGIKLEEVIVLEELPVKEEDYQEMKPKAEEKPIKRALLKLFKKSKYNAKYLEETIPIEKVKRKVPYRTRGIY
ncbi:hypothetical protein LCGC14_1564680 [marine sediment metagenome]|uniref:Uncharacterized protein n=1 Tax=marine sediment metagenome TaxID=412755 RepID=A0A0F9LLZ9_9ZZZZ